MGGGVGPRIGQGQPGEGRFREEGGGVGPRMGWIGTAERRKIVLKKILLIFGRPHLNLKTLKFISSIYFSS